MKGIIKLIGFYIVLTLPTVLLAEILPHIFNAGDPAKASEVNANFNFLLEEIEKQKIGANIGFSHSVDCDLNSSALSEAVEAGYPRIEVSGAECVGGFDTAGNTRIVSANDRMVSIRVPGTERIRFFGGTVVFYDVNIISDKTDRQPAITNNGATFYWIGGQLDGNESWTAYSNRASSFTNFIGVQVVCNGADVALSNRTGAMSLSDVTIIDGAGLGCQYSAIQVEQNGDLAFEGNVNIELIKPSSNLVSIFGASSFKVNNDGNTIRANSANEGALKIQKNSHMNVTGSLTIKGGIRIRYNSSADWGYSSEGNGVVIETDIDGVRLLDVNYSATLNVAGQNFEKLDLNVGYNSFVQFSDVTLNNSDMIVKLGSHVIFENVTESNNIKQALDITSSIEIDF